MKEIEKMFKSYIVEKDDGKMSNECQAKKEKYEALYKKLFEKLSDEQKSLLDELDWQLTSYNGFFRDEALEFGCIEGFKLAVKLIVCSIIS